MSDLRSYAKILTLGHRALEPIADQMVVVEEKVDGSQFSFGVRDGVLLMRSKNAIIQDIGPLIAAVQQDVADESEDEIKAMLYAAYRKEVLRMSTRGLPEWYKRELAFGGTT